MLTPAPSPCLSNRGVVLRPVAPVTPWCSSSCRSAAPAATCTTPTTSIPAPSILRGGSVLLPSVALLLVAATAAATVLLAAVLLPTVVLAARGIALRLLVAATPTMPAGARTVPACAIAPAVAASGGAAAVTAATAAAVVAAAATVAAAAGTIAAAASSSALVTPVPAIITTLPTSCSSIPTLRVSCAAAGTTAAPIPPASVTAAGRTAASCVPAAAGPLGLARSVAAACSCPALLWGSGVVSAACAGPAVLPLLPSECLTRLLGPLGCWPLLGRTPLGVPPTATAPTTGHNWSRRVVAAPSGAVPASKVSVPGPEPTVLVGVPLLGVSVPRVRAWRSVAPATCPAAPEAPWLLLHGVLTVPRLWDAPASRDGTHPGLGATESAAGGGGGCCGSCSGGGCGGHVARGATPAQGLLGYLSIAGAALDLHKHTVDSRPDKMLSALHTATARWQPVINNLRTEK